MLLHVPVEDGDRDDAGALSRPGAERLFMLARDAYFERCGSVDVAALEAREPAIRLGGGELGDLVSVSAGVVEVFPDGFRLSVRVRASAGEVAADVACDFACAGGIPASMRDEFIALAHGAAHVH